MNVIMSLHLRVCQSVCADTHVCGNMCLRVHMRGFARVCAALVVAFLIVLFTAAHCE